ncbi:MAG: desulfoferrodoxin [Bacilli bacterium]|nr:desulfoferrodoxin [Bacilli bacterium]
MKFYRCSKCNNLVIHSQSVISCCNEPMEELIPGHIEASVEKHIPIVEIGNEIVVTVGEVEHPMTPEHSIEWILIELENGYMVTNLKPNQKPVAHFKTSEKIKAAYAYCNLHGLWKTEM